MDPIYRDFSLTRTSVSKAGKFLQELAYSHGSITSMSTLSNGFKREQIQYFSTFFRLKFRNKEDLDTFESFGWKTEKVARVGPA